MSPPAIPAGLTAMGSDGLVTLDWNDNTEPDLSGYTVYRATSAGGPYAPVNPALLADSQYVDSGAAVLTIGPKSGRTDFTFCVTGVTHAAMTYDLGSNTVTCAAYP